MLVPSHTLVHPRVGQGQPADRQRPVGDLYALLQTQRQSANFNTPFSVVLICIEKRKKREKQAVGRRVNYGLEVTDLAINLGFHH